MGATSSVSRWEVAVARGEEHRDRDALDASGEGGFICAREGYDWDSDEGGFAEGDVGSGPGDVADRLFGLHSELTSGHHSALAGMDAETHEKAVDDTWKMANGVLEGWASPLDVANLGRDFVWTDGETGRPMWLGKDVLLGANWSGIRQGSAMSVDPTTMGETMKRLPLATDDEGYAHVLAMGPDEALGPPDRTLDMLAVYADATAYDEAKGMTFDGATSEQEAILRRTIRLQERWEQAFMRYFERLWARRGNAVAAKARSAKFRRGTPLWDPPGDTPVSARADMLIDLDAWDAEATDDVTPMLRDLFTEAVEAVEMYEAKALPEDLIEALEAFVRSWLAPVLTWNRTTAKIVHDILAAEPTTDEQMTEQIAKAGRQAKVSYTRTAISIATGGVNQAQMGAAATGGATHKVWYSARDNRVRTGHRLANGQRVRLLEPFKVRDDNGVEHLLEHPGDITAPPSTTVNCRCLCLWLTSESGFWDRDDDLDPFGRLVGATKSYRPSDLGIKGLG